MPECSAWQQKWFVERLLLHIETTRGRIAADRILLSIGASLIDFADGRASPMSPKPTIFSLTGLIPRQVIREALTMGLAVSDCSQDPDYWTVLQDGRLMFGCSGDGRQTMPPSYTGPPKF